MGRLFWKFFLFTFSAQLLTILAVGSIIWWRVRPLPEGGWPPQPEIRAGLSRAPAEFSRPALRPPQHHFPFEPMLGGALASLISAAALAWYVAKPIRHLRRAVQAAAKGDLSLRVSPDLRKRHDELADLGQDYDFMADQLRSLLESQRRLLHDVSHELRSPLARLQLAIGLAQQQPEQQAKSLLRIEREAMRMNQLIGELLTLSRIEVKKTFNESVDCIALLSQIVDDANFEAAAEGKSVTWLPALDSAVVLGNAELLYRAFENVIRNALRFTPANHVAEIRLLELPAAWQFTIEDEGPGIAQAELAQLFEPFYRGSQQNSTAGYGLGLTIAKRVIDAHGGKITVRNRDVAGLQIQIELLKVQIVE